jgi:hypothetical protein
LARRQQSLVNEALIGFRMPWTTKLARPLVLTDGTELVTFKDTIVAIAKFFAGTPASDPLDRAIGLLVKDDASRKPVDIEAATNEMESVLRGDLVSQR